MNGNIEQQREVVSNDAPNVQVAEALFNDAFTSDAMQTPNLNSNDLSSLGFRDSQSILDMGDSFSMAPSEEGLGELDATDRLEQLGRGSVPEGSGPADSLDLTADANIGLPSEPDRTFDLPEQWKGAEAKPLGEYEGLTPESKEVESYDEDFWTPERMKNAKPTPLGKYEGPIPESKDNLERDNNGKPNDKDSDKEDPSQECKDKYEEEVESKYGRFFTDEDRYKDAMRRFCGE